MKIFLKSIYMKLREQWFLGGHPIKIQIWVLIIVRAHLGMISVGCVALSYLKIKKSNVFVLMGMESVMKGWCGGSSLCWSSKIV